MEDEHDGAISLPHHGFYSVQDESNRRYSRTGKHMILAQKYDAILMKYRYSDETEKSSPYSRTQSDSESPVPSDSPNSYQGVYSPQLAQRSENFEGIPWYSSLRARPSLIKDEPESKWISPGLHPNLRDQSLKDRYFDYDNENFIDQQRTLDTVHKNTTERISDAEGHPNQRPNGVDLSDTVHTPEQAGKEHNIQRGFRQYQHTDNETTDVHPHREPPPPYSVAVRSSKVQAPKSYLDIAPHLTKDLPGVHDINILLEDLEGSAPDHQMLHRNSDHAKPADRANLEITQQSTISAWAELVNIDHSSEDEKPSRPSSGIIITEHRERRTSSPDRHIRFVLEEAHSRAKSDPEDLSAASQDINGYENRQLEENYHQDGKGLGRKKYPEYKNETVGFTPLVDEVFKYPTASGYGVENPGYEHIEDYGHTSVDHRPKQKPVSSDVVRRRAIDWYGKGNVYDSSQSSTLDSVFTERSWSSEVGRPRAFRERRRVYPKPKDPVGDLGDGLQTKSGRKVIGKDHDNLYQGSTSTSRKPIHGDDRGHGRGRGDTSRVERSKRKTPGVDLRKALINRELELFMKRKSGEDEFPPNREHEDSHELRSSSAGQNHNSRSGNNAFQAQRNSLLHPTYRSGNHSPTSQMRMYGNPKPDHTSHKHRAYSTEGIDRNVQLRNHGRGRKIDRPLTYPNDINKPFSRLMSQDDNNPYPADNNAVALRVNMQSTQALQHGHLPRHPIPMTHSHRPERGSARRRYDQKHPQSQAFRRTNDRNGTESQPFHKEPQSLIRSREQPPPSGHVHQSGRPPTEEHPRHAKNQYVPSTQSGRRDGNQLASQTTKGISEARKLSEVEHPKHDRHQHIPSNARRTREKDNWASTNISAVPEVPRNTKSKSNQRRNRDTSEWASSPNIAAVTERPHRPSNSETNPSNNQQGQVEERTPTGQKSDDGDFTNWRFFSMMAAIWFCPIGIWALRKSHQVDSRVAAKDIPGARRAARSARNHSIAAFVVLGFIFLILIARLIEITVDPRKTFIQNYQIVPDEVDLI